MYIKNHKIPRYIRLDQAKCFVRNQVKTFYTRNNIQIIEAPVNDHRANGLVERLIQTIKNRLACIKEKKSKDNAFHVKHDEDTVKPEAIPPDNKWLNGFCSDIVVELGITWATRKAN